MSTENPSVDQNLYSRQLYVLGEDAMKKITSTSVMISGMGGVGVEIAKNIILAGIKNVTIHDTRNVAMGDIAAQFYLNEELIGKNRALACFEQLSGLNSYVSVSTNTQELTNENISRFNCLVLTDWRKHEDIQNISQICHENGVKLIICDVRGVFGYIFNDFGKGFTVTDPTGERPSRFLISMVTNAENGVVTCAEDDPHNLSDGDHVKFEEVEGMVEINDKEFEIRVIDRRHFSIGDTRGFGKYTSVHRSGYGNQVIVPKTMTFESLKDSLYKVGEKTIMFDMCSFGRDQQVILAFMAHSVAMKDSPKVEFADLIKAAKSINSHYKIVEEIDNGVIEMFAHQSECVIGPLCAVFGGIAGQEVLKAVSNKFTPIQQFFSIGYMESVPKSITTTLKNDRYDPYRIVFGDEQQRAMQQLRYFMLGAGALGCEILKNWAMMGVATEGDGRIFVTDMDSIERSNLNRQFLFRDKDIGKMKSSCAAEATRVMNPAIHIESHTNRVGPESAATYHDKFYMSLSGVCNALDNVATRLFSDQQCVFYNKPLLESGTLGPKAHYQMIIPKMTESYASMADPPEKDIPQCTLHNFPSNIDHCCMWARDIFSGIFEQVPDAINKFLKDPNYIESMKVSDPGAVLPTLRNINEFLVVNRIKSYEDCARWARSKFEELYTGRIKLLLSQFPPDALTDTGIPFWTGNKRAPTPLVFNPQDPLHADFVRSASNILARIFHIREEGDPVELAANASIPEWKSNEVIKINDEKKPSTSATLTDSDAEEINGLLLNINTVKTEFKLVTPEEFEKDNDANGHIDFVSSAANLRATNYQIANASKLDVKRIAGKIIPAIATTTAMICGFVCLEMYKVHSIVSVPLSNFRSGFINLAINLYAISEPQACPETVCPANNQKMTLWDSWIIEGDLTTGQFVDQVKKKYNATVDMITIGKFLLYMSVMPENKRRARLQTKISEILTNEANYAPLTDDQMFISVTALCINDDGDDINTPPIVLRIK